ncbi:hypothetical protein JHK87_011685 [Glycine soja]|nr:hypothetical protein JHK87_011685 [Glycine soja]
MSHCIFTTTIAARKKCNIGTYGYPTPAVKKIESYYDVPEGVDIRGRYNAEFAKILTKDALKFVAELQHALSPSWKNPMRGQVKLKDAVAGTISLHDKVRNRDYKLNDQTTKLFVQPRGWYLPEAHILIDGEPATGCLVDFGLYFYHNHLAFRRTQGQAERSEGSGLIPTCMKVFNNNMGNAPNLMEDAATAEISRVQNWQWLKYGDGLGVKVNK